MARARETLLGPLVIGLIAGPLTTALAMFGFDSGYYRTAAHSESSPWWLITTSHAFLGFIAVSVAIILLFGVLPLLIRRVSASKNK